MTKNDFTKRGWEGKAPCSYFVGVHCLYVIKIIINISIKSNRLEFLDVV